MCVCQHSFRNISGTILKKMAFMELDEISGWNTAALLY